MKLVKSLCFAFLFSAICIISGQQFSYPNYGQRTYPNIPAEIIDVPNGVDQQQRFPVSNGPFQPRYKPNNYGFYPYPYNYGGYYPPGHQYPTFQPPKPQDNLPNLKQLPKYMFKNPTSEFPNGYYVIPGSQRVVEVPPETIKVPEANATPNEGVQEYPGYVIKQTSQRYQSPNQNPIKITSSTVEHKPFHTVLTRYIDRHGKPVIKLENENGTMTLDGQGSTSLNINNGKLEINGVDPSKITTTTEKIETTVEPEDATPKDVSSWLG